MKKIIFSIIFIFVIILIFLFVNRFFESDDSVTISGNIMTGNFNGKVIDSMTKEPLQGIPIQFVTEKTVMKGFVDSDFKHVRDEIYYTDKQGKFSIPVKEEIIFNFYSENIWVNMPNNSKTKSNSNYSIYSRSYMKKPWPTIESNNQFFPFNKKTNEEMIIELEPINKK